MAERRRKKLVTAAGDAGSFASIAKLWVDHWATDKTPRHVGMTWRRLERNSLPLLGARPITEIKPSEIVQMVKSIEARGVGNLARRSFETVAQIFRYAIAHGYTSHNPVSQIKPADVLRPISRKNYARIDARELPALLRAIETYAGKPATRLALRLMALTFVRTSELIGARWEEFDLSLGVHPRWNIPASRMKAGRPHIVPLSTQAVEILELLRGVTGAGEYLFPGEREPP